MAMRLDMHVRASAVVLGLTMAGAASAQTKGPELPPIRQLGAETGS